MTTWRCVAGCGACCHLDPNDRPHLEQYLSAQELVLYHSMVGSDGWCIHFDPDQRQCKIYLDRPRFCRVEPEVFEDLYDVPPDRLDSFAIRCCKQQIHAIYGRRSPEMQRFNQAIHSSP